MLLYSKSYLDEINYCRSNEEDPQLTSPGQDQNRGPSIKTKTYTYMLPDLDDYHEGSVCFSFLEFDDDDGTSPLTSPTSPKDYGFSAISNGLLWQNTDLRLKEKDGQSLHAGRARCFGSNEKQEHTEMRDGREEVEFWESKATSGQSRKKNDSEILPRWNNLQIDLRYLHREERAHEGTFYDPDSSFLDLLDSVSYDPFRHFIDGRGGTVVTN
ncbi:hypothetical protein CBS101457_003833 [Exobasidium rhododendri]|nr:hypothetical protein CBS101457_003833 [Exobasidium rhododendri]